MVDARPENCPDCGNPLSHEPWAAGLCVLCLASLARLDSTAERLLEGEGPEGETLDALEAPTMATEGAGERDLGPGHVLGERYRIRSHLGSGGMGDVWRAFDLKLRVDVALKSVRAELVSDQRALESLRQEVRVAREVISPNVCRVFDLQEVAGQEWISMEYVDGTTLLDILKARSPLGLDEARDLASQFLGGLEAIHDAGLVHRDIKPENLMVTRAGRVVVMDFGIAKSLEEGRSLLVSGTPAYMSPEQAKGDRLDARADVFAAGVVLAEMVVPGGTRSLEARRAIWMGVHAEEPEIADTPWGAVIRQATAGRREERHGSASVLARSLEEVTLRAAGDEVARPYPGLAAFASEDAPYFFGRELEVEGLWKKLRRPHLQALIAPSGAGKSSFLRAGILATLPEGWRAIVATPGRRPFDALAQALLPELADDKEAAAGVLAFEDPRVASSLVAKWRRRHDNALIIVDQFEELFTQSPGDVQEAFADLLARLPLDADVHVLLAMREDFHFHCQPFESLAPVFSETTALGALGGSSLRRALVQPALKCGYRFEDDSLVDEMVSEVSHERGALPLLAFAAAQLWEKRDRENGFLTRAAYEEIGGVGGALGQHAEATLERIGEDGQPIVRELFRNLVTAQGTRAARDREELLSVFDSSSLGPSGIDAAGRVLDTLIDARLLTTYEEASDEGADEGRTRVEVIHESLIANWPRLVRWRTQDAEGAQLRDDLRQTAQRWQERGEPDDLLWAGTSFKEYELWRERYPGGLSATEESFARAMTARAERRVRQRRLALAAAFTVLLVVLGVVGGFWRRAVGEARRAEAQKLLAIGQLELERYPTATLAYATRSIELADSPEGRELALEALWRSPPIWQASPDGSIGSEFSPDGGWLAISRWAQTAAETKARVISADGAERLMGETVHGQRLAGVTRWFDADQFLSLSPKRGERGVLYERTLWSASRARAVATFSAPPTVTVGWDAERRRRVELRRDGQVSIHRLGSGLRDWTTESADPDDGGGVSGLSPGWLSNDGRWIAGLRGDDVLLQAVGEAGLEPARVLGRHEGASLVATSLGSEHFVTRSTSGEIMVWDAIGDGSPRVFQGPGGEGDLGLNDDGSMVWVRFRSGEGGDRRVWIAKLEEDGQLARHLGELEVADERIALDSARLQAGVAIRPPAFGWARLDAPLGTRPIRIPSPIASQVNGIDIDPTGRWMAATTTAVYFSSLERPYPFVVAERIGSPRFDPQGRWLAYAQGDTYLRGLGRGGWGPGRKIWDGPSRAVEVSPDGSFVVVAAVRNEHPQPILVSVEDGSAEVLPDGFVEQAYFSISSDGHYVAGSGGGFGADEDLVKVWDVETRGLVGTHDPVVPIAPTSTAFTADNEVLWSSSVSQDGDGEPVQPGLWSWNFETGGITLIHKGPVDRFQVSADSRWVVMRLIDNVAKRTWLEALDLENGRVVPLPAHGESIRQFTLDPEGRTVASVDHDEGIIRVGPVTGGEPHLLFGHSGSVNGLAIDPLGRWLISAGTEETRYWPLPDVNEKPLQDLTRQEALDLLRAQTNLRLVEDPEAENGWALRWERFPGWERTPPRW